MRLLVLSLLIYLAYRLFKNWVLPRQSSIGTPEQAGSTMVDDVMVKDPFCETYFPKRNGIKKVLGGQTHYFCSTECRDKYLEAKKDPK
jgi:YHS domain-containing protein